MGAFPQTSLHCAVLHGPVPHIGAALRSVPPSVWPRVLCPVLPSTVCPAPSAPCVVHMLVPSVLCAQVRALCPVPCSTWVPNAPTCIARCVPFVPHAPICAALCPQSSALYTGLCGCVPCAALCPVSPVPLSALLCVRGAIRLRFLVFRLRLTSDARTSHCSGALQCNGPPRHCEAVRTHARTVRHGTGGVFRRRTTVRRGSVSLGSRDGVCPQATKQSLVSTIGETLLLMEVHSTNYYWHVPQNIEIYPKVFPTCPQGAAAGWT